MWNGIEVEYLKVLYGIERVFYVGLGGWVKDWGF